MFIYNPNLELWYVKENILNDWNWVYISQNKNITMNDIRENPNLPWNWFWILSNPSITYDDIIDNKFDTNGKINLRHLLMLNDFANMNLQIDYITSDEFSNYKEQIRKELEIFSFDIKF